MRISISVDVPDLDAGTAFYGGTFGLTEAARPGAGMVLLTAGDQRLLLLARSEGSPPFPGAALGRSYAPHWTPVHLDFHIDDLRAVRDRALAAGARQEAWFEPPDRPPVGFFRDPFGHGFCLIGNL